MTVSWFHVTKVKLTKVFPLVNFQEIFVVTWTSTSPSMFWAMRFCRTITSYKESRPRSCSSRISVREANTVCTVSGLKAYPAGTNTKTRFTLIDGFISVIMYWFGPPNEFSPGESPLFIILLRFTALSVKTNNFLYYRSLVAETVLLH